MHFNLHIQTDTPIQELAKWLSTTPELKLQPLETRSSLRGLWQDFGNDQVHCRLFENDEHNPDLLQEDDAWLYYRYILEGSAAGSKVGVRELQPYAEGLVERALDLDAQVELLTDWDEED